MNDQLAFSHVRYNQTDFFFFLLLSKENDVIQRTQRSFLPLFTLLVQTSEINSNVQGRPCTL